MKGKRLLKFMYINLFFPVICLYVLPKMRLAANKAVEDTLLYTQLETFMLLSFFIYGICLLYTSSLSGKRAETIHA